MEETPLSRAYLESLSTADLFELGENLGVDLPEGLNRRLIIGELLELAEDNLQDAADLSVIVDADFSMVPEELPETYNETRITALLRDPAWLFVYWDFHSTAFAAASTHHRFESFFLRVNTLTDDPSKGVADYFDVDVGIHDRKWYIHIPNRKQGCRVDLYVRNSQEKEQLLARSSEISVPPGGAGELHPPARKRIPPLITLSGLEELRKHHFKNHRQAFS